MNKLSRAEIDELLKDYDCGTQEAINAVTRQLTTRYFSESEEEWWEQTKKDLAQFVKGGDFQRVIRLAFVEIAKAKVGEVVARRMPEAEKRIEAIVAAEFDQQVTRVAHERLEGAINEVRERMGRRS